MAFSWPTIPDPGSDLPSLASTIQAMKNILEILTGQRASSNPAPMMRVFKSVVKPGAANSGVDISQLHDGDMWIDLGNNAKLSYWNVATKVWLKTS